MKNNQLSSTKDIFTIPSLWKAIRNLISKLGGGAPIVGNVVIEPDLSKALYVNDFSSPNSLDGLDTAGPAPWILTEYNGKPCATTSGGTSGTVDAYIAIPFITTQEETIFSFKIMDDIPNMVDKSYYAYVYVWDGDNPDDVYVNANASNNEEWSEISVILYGAKQHTIYIGFFAYSNRPAFNLWVTDIIIQDKPNLITTNYLKLGGVKATNVNFTQVDISESLSVKDGIFSNAGISAGGKTFGVNPFYNYFDASFYNRDFSVINKPLSVYEGYGDIKGTNGVSKFNLFRVAILNSTVGPLANIGDGSPYPIFMLSSNGDYNGSKNNVVLTSLNATEAASMINSRLQIGFIQDHPDQDNMSDLYVNKTIEIETEGEGILLRTPDGTKQYKITIDNAGALVSTLVV